MGKEVKDGGKVTFYCNADNCNAEKEIKGIIVKGDGPKTIAAMTAANKAPTAEDGGVGSCSILCCYRYHCLQCGHGPSCPLKSNLSTVFFSVECPKDSRFDFDFWLNFYLINLK